MRFAGAIRLTLAFGILAFAGLSTTAEGSIILGNILANGDLPSGNNDGTGTQIGGGGGLNNVHQAVVFTVGSLDVEITDVILRLSSYNTDPVQANPQDTVGLGFYTSNGAVPGTLVGSLLTAPVVPAVSSGAFTFTPSGALTLMANTQYWMVMNRVSSGNWRWDASTTGNTVPAGLATFNFFQTSLNNGTTFGLSAVQNSFVINGTAVPEPSTIILMGVGVGALYLRRRAKRPAVAA